MPDCKRHKPSPNDPSRCERCGSRLEPLHKPQTSDLQQTHQSEPLQGQRPLEEPLQK